jgi:uncharacterized protein
VILLDVNILLYAYDREASHHAEIRIWLEELLTSSTEIGVAWLTIWAFVRISTNSRINEEPLTPRVAFRTLNELLARPDVAIIEPGRRHIQILEQLVIDGQAAGPRVTDAALAALAIEHGATLASTDRDFSRFPDLRWINPLSPS